MSISFSETQGCIPSQMPKSEEFRITDCFHFDQILRGAYKQNFLLHSNEKIVVHLIKQDIHHKIHSF